MNYISTVIGTLTVEDINIQLHYMEIIDLSAEDFKASPRLREAHRNKQLIPYDPKTHRNAKKFNRFTKNAKLHNKPQPEAVKTEIKFSEASTIKKSLEGLSDKLGGLVNRINILITRQLETSEKLNDNFEKFFEDKRPPVDLSSLDKFTDKTTDHYKKMEELWEKRLSQKEDKIDKLIKKIDEFMDKGIKVNGNGQTYTGNSASTSLKGSGFDDKVTFVPDINIKEMKTKVKTEKVTQEGTDDILAKLKAMKGN
jgi:hypothetical protein